MIWQATVLAIMRRILLATLAILTLLLAPVALASGGHGHEAAPAATTSAKHHENETAENETGDNETAEHDAHAAADANFGSRMHALTASFRENVTALIQGCHSADPAPQGHANDTSRAEHRSWAHCVANGFEALKIQFHADKKELRQERRAEREAADKPASA